LIAGGPPAAPADPGDPSEGCPYTALGHLAGTFYAQDSRGQVREFSARDTHSRAHLMSLSGGDATWFREQYPKRVQQGEEWITIDFKIAEAGAALQRACFAAGLWGDHIILRKPGTWRCDDQPAVHCGDGIFMRGAWHDPGTRVGNQIWVAAAPTARPGIPCPAAICRELQDGLKLLWNWREAGAPIVIMGLIANGLLGVMPEWRTSAFIIGSTGAGKSALQQVLRAALPLHFFTNDTSKAGVEQAVDGRAMPILIDEAADRANRGVARELVDLVLSSAGNEGTRGLRGTVDGKGRRIEVAGSIICFSIVPPDLEPQHLGRFVIVELLRPEDGEDHRLAHLALAKFARTNAADLWARALTSWDRYCVALHAFRRALIEAKCAPREADQAGALLAGWWILTREGNPDAACVREGLTALDPERNSGFIRLAAEVEADDRPRRMLNHLLASMVMLHRSTDRETVADLLAEAWRGEGWAARLLPNYGIRPVLADERSPRPPDMSGDGTWFANSSGCSETRHSMKAAGGTSCCASGQPAAARPSSSSAPRRRARSGWRVRKSQVKPMREGECTNEINQVTR